MEKMLKNEVAKNELKEVRHSEEWHKSGEKVKYRLADAMKSCMKKHRWRKSQLRRSRKSVV